MDSPKKMKDNLFNGKKIASEKELELKKDVDRLRKKSIFPKLVSIVVGDERGGRFYQNLKKKAAERVGAVVKIVSLKADTGLKEIVDNIEFYNSDNKVHGVMIQLPLPDYLKPKTTYLINIIDPKKDVDGLREDSLFLTPVVKAVLAALIEATYVLSVGSSRLSAGLKIVVVGAKGFEGRKITRVLRQMGYKVDGVDIDTKDPVKSRQGRDHGAGLKRITRSADVVISVTGKADLIKTNLVKEGCAVIDVGAPYGDMDKKVYKKAAFVSPVPGGIGPVTISMLLENLIEAAKGIEN